MKKCQKDADVQHLVFTYNQADSRQAERDQHHHGNADKKPLPFQLNDHFRRFLPVFIVSGILTVKPITI